MVHGPRSTNCDACASSAMHPDKCAMMTLLNGTNEGRQPKGGKRWTFVQENKRDEELGNRGDRSSIGERDDFKLRLIE